MSVMTADHLELQPRDGLGDMQQRLHSLDSLLLWRIVQDGGISDELLASTGSTREELDSFLAQHELEYGELRNLASSAHMLDLQDLFELARARLGQMLAACTKPGELRTLIACIRQLPGGKSLVAACDRAHEAVEELLQNGRTGADALGPGRQVGELKAELLQMLESPELNRQQRRSLERQLRKLQK